MFVGYFLKRCVNLPRSWADTSFPCVRKDSISEGVKRRLPEDESAFFFSEGGSSLAGVMAPHIPHPARKENGPSTRNRNLEEGPQ